MNKQHIDTLSSMFVVCANEGRMAEGGRVMPIMFANDDYKAALRKRAEAQVRAKFPNLMEGSSGWYRAMASRMRRAT